jgi:N-acetylglutamate synthase-like GNAT family acetyltransferase
MSEPKLRRDTLAGAGTEPVRRSAAPRFSERDFYLAEFRDRTVAFTLSDLESGEFERLESVLEVLDANGTRTLLIGPDRAALARLAGRPPVEIADEAWVGRLWHTLTAESRAGLWLGPGESVPGAACRVALRLKLAKLVIFDRRGGLEDPGGRRISSVDLAALDDLAPKLGTADRALLAEIRGLLLAGFPSVTVCSADGLEDELFTWSGSGTFFTRERYASVRHLGIDEFAAAEELVRRGVEEGYLLPRSDAELEALLANAYGVFVEGRFLAGIGALIPYPAERAAEIASLYTLTRFVGEGVGAHLVRFARDRAAIEGLGFVFACTTSERVARFFERHGFHAVAPSALPAEKWARYDPSRRDQVRCFRLDIARSSPS